LKRAPGREHGARSFRFLLATRVTLGLTGAVTAVGLLSYLGLREALDRELEASMLSVASIQAASVTDDPTGAMHFHEWELTPEEAASVRDLVRFLQVWDADGQSLVRTRLLDEDLPMDTAAFSRAVAGELVWTDGASRGNRSGPCTILWNGSESSTSSMSFRWRHPLMVATVCSSGLVRCCSPSW
jgi:hypothetical protein